MKMDFERLYEDSVDPWGFRTRWYERRKRALVLACLSRPRYRSGFELGCSNGELTADLSERVDRVLGCDVAEQAIASAKLRTAHCAGVRLVTLELPQQWPMGSFDLVIISEIAYYLEPAVLLQLLQRVNTSLTDDAEVIACHWRHPIPGNTLTGDLVHQVVFRWAQKSGLTRVAEHREADFLVDSFTRDHRSVAKREGLC